LGGSGLSMTASAGYNISLLAIPMVAGLYDAAVIARFALFDIGNAFAVFRLSRYLAWRYSPGRGESSLGIRGIVQMFFGSIPFVSYMLAILMNILGIKIEGFAARFLEIPADMNRGVSLLVLGLLLRFRFPAGTWKAIIPPLLLRYVFGLIAGSFVLFLLPIQIEHQVAITGALIMPVGLSVIPYAIRWGYDRDRAAAILNAGIPIVFILFWLVWVASNYIPALQP
jgi:predicted permease